MKKQRNLDGVYFRVKRENGYEAICFSDLTNEERNEILASRENEWLAQMCRILADTIYGIGEQFDIVGE